MENRRYQGKRKSRENDAVECLSKKKKTSSEGALEHYLFFLFKLFKGVFYFVINQVFS